MRKFVNLLAAAAGMGLLATATASAQAVPKIGYIDSRKIIQEAPGAKEAQATFQKEMEGYQAQLKVMEDSIKSLMSEYEQKQVMLSPEAKKQKEEEIRQKQAAYQQKANDLEQKLNQRQSELVQPIMDKVKDVIEQLRKSGGYAMIFDAAGSGLVAADPSLDLTDQVLAKLKANAATPAPSKPGARKP